MSPEPLASLLPSFKFVARDFCRLAGTDTLEAAFKELRRVLEEQGTDFTKWVHQIVTQMHPACEENALDPNNLSPILELLEQPGGCLRLLELIPDERAAEIQEFLRFLHREGLPAIRSSLDPTKKLLPHEPAGGRPPAADQVEMQTICKDLAQLEASQVPRGEAQKRLAARHDVSLRVIQRIWRDCPQNPKNSG